MIYNKNKNKLKLTDEQRALNSRINGAAPKPEEVYVKAEPVKWKEPNEFDLAELYSSQARYTAEEKLQAVTAYAMTGTINGAVRLTGLKQRLISDWKNNSSWWPDAYSAVKKQKQEEMDGTITTIIHAASNEVLDRVLNGDEYVCKNTGDLKRKKMGGKELSVTLGVLYDKRALLRGDPTSRSEKTDTGKLLEQLKNQFAEMAQGALNPTIIKTVDTKE